MSRLVGRQFFLLLYDQHLQARLLLAHLHGGSQTDYTASYNDYVVLHGLSLVLAAKNSTISCKMCSELGKLG
jgi:hypothetical protein